jgi:hypothetical protein
MLAKCDFADMRKGLKTDPPYPFLKRSGSIETIMNASFIEIQPPYPFLKRSGYIERPELAKVL